ncbi:MAG: hypothetical protein IKE66_00650 [Hyphomicrobium sp.]|nr:hypothetical protein [Hyphomicrobium sp.]
MTSRITFLTIALMIGIALLPKAAYAASCAEAAIEARGEQSRYEWSAKGKARANWRSKVRRTPGLGAAYANWARAQNAEEHCMSGPAGTLCVFTGIPCMP